MILAKTWFRKRDSHLITYKSGGNANQIDFFLTRRVGRSCCIDCKVIPGKQDVKLKRDEQASFVDILIKETNRKDEVDSNMM